MTVNKMDLGLTACRALMRDLNDKPIVLEIYNPRTPGRHDYEPTHGYGGWRPGSYVTALVPTLDMISVRAQLRHEGFDLYEQAILSPGSDDPFKPYIFLYYPEDPAGIVGPEFGAKLREAVDKAVAAVESARALR